jgi:Ni,Fe-hydrogenase III large subunit
LKGARRTRLAGPEQRAAGEAEVARLREELAAARAQLAAVEREGADAFTRRRLAELEEARLVARGQALDAAAARAKAEAELRSLRDSIERAPGLRGRVLRWAARGLTER